MHMSNICTAPNMENRQCPLIQQLYEEVDSVLSYQFVQ